MTPDSLSHPLSGSWVRQRALFWALVLAFTVGLLTWEFQHSRAGGSSGIVSAEASPLAMGEGCESGAYPFDALDVDNTPPLRLQLALAFSYELEAGDSVDHCGDCRSKSHPARAPPRPSIA